MTGPVVRLLIAAALFHVVLVQPTHPDALRWGTLAFFPLELPVILLGLAVLRPGTAQRLVRVALVGFLTLMVVLKGADYALHIAFARGFNPVSDLILIEAGLRLLTGTIGGVQTVLAVLAVLGGLVVTARGLWWATGVWAGLASQRSQLRMAVAAAALVAFGAALVDVAQGVPGSPAPFDPPGMAFTTRVGMERFTLARATLSDFRAFERAAAMDDWAETDTALNLIDRDVIIVFVESYGRTSFDTALYADLHRATLAKGEARLAARGVAMASGFVASPTRGGQSWLAHATFANGLWIDGQSRYGAVLASGRQTLFHIAAAAGFQTAAVMPQITLDWPESTTMGFETILDASSLGYKGLPFNWVTMPDQFTYAALDRQLRGPARVRPLFVQVATGTSHAPWVPVPDLVPWDQIGDGQIFNPMATAGDPPDVVWRDRDRVRAQYRLAVDYALRAVLAYAERHAEDPPLMIVLGDHQAAGFVALEDRPDVPMHVIGPAHLVERVAQWGLTPGLTPSDDAPVLPMDSLRDLVLRSFTTDGPTAAQRMLAPPGADPHL